MNFAILPFSIIWISRSFAVPEGTPGYLAATGTIQTCTASGFLFLLTAVAIPIYYSSLSLHAFVAIKNNFQEQQYRWIEKYIHLVAWLVPLAFATTFAATDNLNPSTAGCYVSRAPLGCDTDVSCERGKDIGKTELVFSVILLFIYLIFTPTMVIAIYIWIWKVEKRTEGARGMERLRQSARKHLMKNVATQLSVYLLSFLITWLPILVAVFYRLIHGKSLYNLLIFGNCMHSLSGFIFATVYFALQHMGNKKKVKIRRGRLRFRRRSSAPPLTVSEDRHTVEDIRLSADRKGPNIDDAVQSNDDDNMVFNVFDGVPDENSPWARFIDAEDDDLADDNPPNDAP